MGGCSTHSIQAVPPDAVTSRVEDMICGHCVGAFKTTIVTGLPGAEVEASPAFSLVSVNGATDLSFIKAIVTNAGYTPTAA